MVFIVGRFAFDVRCSHTRKVTARLGNQNMHKVRVWAELSDEHFKAYQAEAKCRGVSVEDLVQQTVNFLLRELEQEEDDCTGPDHYISVS